ncbi:MAG: exo-alpha-sialidase [Ruminococcaceae bacterium]|nr:exo-alpha-sialidase [Oscillospiraceae bacterium]
MNKITPLAPTMSIIHHSPDPQHIFTYSPGVCVLKSGRIIATLDTLDSRNGEKIGYIYISDDGGKSWRFVTNFPFYHARPFISGDSVYIIGHYDKLMIIRSDDEGETWSEASVLDENSWHQAPCNVLHAKGNVYLVMERVTEKLNVWAVSVLAPVLMRAKEGTDLLKRENWTFASEITFKSSINPEDLNYFGAPFYPFEFDKVTEVAPGRYYHPMGWLESNVVQYTDPNHIWYDEKGCTFHIWMRAHTGSTNIAAMIKVVEIEDGTMTTAFEKAPTGKPIVYFPFPGGQMKFHIIYDEKTKLYWLLSTQSTDSAVKAALLPKERYDLPDNERQRLVLHFSKNCIDWVFAGLVDKGVKACESRHYASMDILGDDLIILSRSGDENALNPHQTDMISAHKIENFRDLVY